MFDWANMKEYTVKEIAESAGVSQETVRRWIREGKLEGAKASRKQGNRITEDALLRFVKMNPAARAGIAGFLGVSSVVLGPVAATASIGAGMAIGTALTNLGALKKEVDKGNNIESLAITINEASKVADGLRESIAEKTRMAEALAQEIEAAREIIDDLDRVVKEANAKMLKHLGEEKGADK